MKLRNVFVIAAIGAALVAPLFFREPLSLTAAGNSQNVSSMGVTAKTGVSCNSSCQNGVLRLMDAYSEYDDRKKGRDSRNLTLNDKGISVISMVESKVNKRPGFLVSSPS